MPIVIIEAPPGLRLEKKKRMVEKITNAIDEAYEIGDTLIFLHEDSPENVAMNGSLQSENSNMLELLRKIST
jgi:phenylpyruvate tautomerase PptA (4-oxalocrotonate tautomerase family)